MIEGKGEAWTTDGIRENLRRVGASSLPAYWSWAVHALCDELDDARTSMAEGKKSRKWLIAKNQGLERKNAELVARILSRARDE